MRYHHDGKHNVLGLDGPFEVYGTQGFICRSFVPADKTPLK